MIQRLLRIVYGTPPEIESREGLDAPPSRGMTE
jgi:hypothetical protein